MKRGKEKNRNFELLFVLIFLLHLILLFTLPGLKKVKLKEEKVKTIKLGLKNKLEMGNMDSFRDWGHSKDYVKAMNLIVQQDEADDYVVATGKTRSVRDMCDYVFSQLDLDYNDYVVQNPKFLRPEELKYLRGDSKKIRETLNWKPDYTFESLMDEMIEHWKDYFSKGGK